MAPEKLRGIRFLATQLEQGHALVLCTKEGAASRQQLVTALRVGLEGYLYPQLKQGHAFVHFKEQGDASVSIV